ncbi:DoxX family protein [Mucilaginibacter sp.]|jgi:hypothetical protein|uniref:DoxX family protein n=1 Tax=Mucilaginibacter sp. TaxID=1882438 RepID=UPI002C318D77|nr:DoxX family protein [Mucilaginibacter sp.]HTI59064.1 DoxX family protein [Mucilaginibacter sp.]
MDIMILAGLLLLGGLINFIWEPDAKPVHSLAKAYLMIAIYLALAVWILFFAGIKNAFLLKALNILIHYGAYATHLVLGYMATNIFIRLHAKYGASNDTLLPSTVNITLWAISVSIGNSFLVATVGKSTNMSIMIDFFKQSGYAIWFLYFIMAMETVGALGILLHFKFKAGKFASAGLVLIMLGAIYTHWHNHDPFSDSYAALTQLLNLSLLLFIYYLEKQVARKLSDTQIYII